MRQKNIGPLQYLCFLIIIEDLVVLRIMFYYCHIISWVSS